MERQAMKDDYAIGFLPPLIVLGTICLVLLTGCASTMAVLEGADAACADVELNSLMTGSQARGRIIKLPEGQQLTSDLADTLCQ
jgi:hypothetical protein